jgi:ring-1,2-phenylacetyl-CoA epoxidase subunit PaaD
VVVVTPTYSGCPATAVIALSIELALQRRGIAALRLETRLSPAWTTDWISAEGRRKLREYGIAPPAESAARIAGLARRAAPVIPCPRCGSTDTEVTSQFGSTACKALHRCLACREPFDYFKCH